MSYAVTLAWGSIPLASRTGYHVFLNGTQVADTTAQSHTFTNLAAGQYTLSVRAHDSGSGVSTTYSFPYQASGNDFAVPVAASGDGRSLIDQYGNPYLMLGNQILPSLYAAQLSDIKTVLADRASRGFNAAWICLLNDSYIESGASTGPSNTSGNSQYFDWNGNQPFTGTWPNLNTPPTDGSNTGATVAAYWDNVDAIVQYARTLGTTCCFCPAQTGLTGSTSVVTALSSHWGDAGWYAYGQFLGSRYGSYPNILWYHGNDFGNGSSWTSSPPSTSDDLSMLNVLAGIKASGDVHLHTVELNYNLSLSGDDSSTETGAPGGTFTNGWRGQINANQFYTYYPTYDPALKAYRGIHSNDAFSQAQRYTPQPVFLGESNYEGADNVNGGHNAYSYTLRCQNYWTVLSGGLMGQLWGNKIVHHFESGWASNLATEGATEAGIWASFFQSIAFQKLVPDGLPDPTVAGNHTFVTAGYGTYVSTQTALTSTNAVNGSGSLLVATNTYVTAAVAADGSLGVAYTPVIQTMTVDMAKMNNSATVTARWFDPTAGTYTSIGTYPSSGSQTFTPSGAHSDGASDWVLVLTA